MKDRSEQQLEILEHGTPCSFSDWPNSDIPDIAVELYSVWRQREFIYVGMSGRGLIAADIQKGRNDGHKRKVLFSRLNSPACGRRSSDQFSLYICDR